MRNVHSFLTIANTSNLCKRLATAVAKSAAGLALIASVVFAGVVFGGCSSNATDTGKHNGQDRLDARQKQGAGLKDYYKEYFKIGVAVNSHNIKGPEKGFILQEFNSITPENDMKMGPIHPKQNQYDFRASDSIVAFARENGLKIRGHNLCWHEQAPDWLFKDSRVKENDKDKGKGLRVSRDSLFARLRSHIHTVVGRYRKDIYAWDVVNEAISDDSTQFLRVSPFTEICGPSYIDSAFWYAHQADPGAELYYNDYNAVRPEKARRIYKLLKGLLERGVPITGVGIQGHWSIYQPNEAELRSALDLYKSLGLKVQITELDVSVFPWEKNKRALLPRDNIVYKGELEKKQTAFYKMVFKVFRDYKDIITSVTFWNVSDKDTWLNHYPVEGRKNYPLLFDSALNRKPAYQAVTDF